MKNALDTIAHEGDERMEWLGCIRKTIDLIDEGLSSTLNIQDIATKVYASPFFLQKGFAVMTGYTMAEYVRNRRLYQAALELRDTTQKIIDIALKYGYETPESFTKAFTRFHGITPTQARAGGSFKAFLPLKISINILGGNQMNVKITKINSFKIIGFAREFTYAEEREAIPKFWDEVNEKYGAMYAGKTPENPLEKAFAENGIGEYGVCLGQNNGKTLYVIAGEYKGGEVPEGMSVHTIEGGEFAIFDCIGPMPDAIQSVTTKIFKEWLPGNPDYALAREVTIEWYDNGNVEAEDYHSAVWLPVQRK